MKKIIFALFILLNLQKISVAQIPQAMNYQAVARNANGTLLQLTNISLRFSILDGGPGGTPQYVETQSQLTNQFGLFTVNIGKGTVQSGNFAFINWVTGNKYLKVEMDATGGTNYTLASTTELLSVPYALVAERLSVQPQIILDDLIDVYTPAPIITGQVLKFNGVTWMADADSNTIYRAGKGLSLSGDTFSLQPISQILIAGDGITFSGDTISSQGGAGNIYAAGNGLSLSGDTFSLLPLSQILIAGNGITLSGDTISAQTGSTIVYSAGNGLSLSGDTFSLLPVSQILIAGNGITITGDTISAQTATGNLVAGYGISIDSDTVSLLPLSQLLIAGNGIKLSGDTVYNIGDIDPGNDITNLTTAFGDLRGGYPGPEVSGLLGIPIYDTIPGQGEALIFDSVSASWKPSLIIGGNFSLPYNDSVNVSSDALAIHNTGSGNAAYFSADTGFALITGNGNVGVGTLTPSSKLDVNGDIKSSGKILRSQTGASNMVPIAFGTMDAAGNIYVDASTDNFTVTKIGLGAYDISIAGEVFDVTKYSVSVSLADGIAGVTAYSSFNGLLSITSFDFPSGLASDRVISFQVYKK